MHRLSGSDSSAVPREGATAAGQTSEVRLTEAIRDFVMMIAASERGDVDDFPRTTAEAEIWEAHRDERMRRLHDALGDQQQLLISRFFLTAVHRGALLNEHFSAQMISSPERRAARQAEFDDLTSNLNEMIETVSVGVPAELTSVSQPLAAAFLWSLAWWCHARRDVVGFVDGTEPGPDALAALGRRADPHDTLSNRIYFEAAEAVATYRRQAAASIPGARSSPVADPGAGLERFGTAPESGSHM